MRIGVSFSALFARLGPWAPLLVFFGFGGLYLSGLATGPAGGDTGEFMAVAGAGGVPHPPGYPLYTLGLRLVAGLLPWGSVAWRASALSAVLAAGALAVLQRATARLAGPGWAALAVGALGLGLGYWRMATVAEVFAGAALTEALIVSVSVSVLGGWRGSWAAAALGAAVGLGVAHHHTVVALAPLVLWSLSALGAEPGGRARIALSFAAALAPGFLVYGTLFYSGGGWRWGDPEDLSALVRMILRLDYGTFSLTVDGATSGARHLAAFLVRRPSEWHLWFALPAVVGVVAGLRGPARGWVGALLASWLLMGPVLVSRFHTSVDHGAFLQRFYLLSDVLLVPVVALGLQAMARLRPAAVAVTSVAALVLGALPSAAVAPHAARQIIPRWVDAVLDTLPPGAVMVVDGDTPMSALLYAQEVQGRRRDVVVVAEGLIGARWFGERLARVDPTIGEAVEEASSLLGLLAMIEPSRPVFFTAGYSRRADLQAKAGPLVPTGGLLLERVDRAEAPSLSEVVRENAAAAARLDLGPPLLSPLWERRTEEAWPAGQAALVWEAIAQAAGRQGQEQVSRACRERARLVRPDFGAAGLGWY